ncbi:MAG: hypothetical protein PHN38_08705 [Sulfurospirillaceae bacterium]|nr:hypothetical protein [Sulfurospirillaceae bacterium]
MQENASNTNTMVDLMAHYDCTMRYLESNFDHTFFAEHFSNEHTTSLLGHLQKTFEDFHLESSLHIIINALNDFFNSHHQETNIAFQDNHFAINVKSPLSLLFENIQKIDLHNIRSAICSIAKELDKYYHNHDLVIIDEETSKKIISFLGSLDTENIKKIITYKFFKILNLKKEDKVFFIKSKIAIRLNSRTKEGEKNEKRFCGIPENELQDLENSHFNRDFFEKGLNTALKKSFKTELDISKFSNEKFCSTYIKIFQAIVSKLLIKARREMDGEVFVAFTNYVLRQYFDFMLEKIAEYILELVKKRVAGIISFLTYYDGEIIFENKLEIHKKPTIIDSNGTIWTYGTIFSCCAQLERVENQLWENEHQKQEIEQKMEQLCENIVKLKEEKGSAVEQINALDSQIKALPSNDSKHQHSQKDMLIMKKNHLEKNEKNIEIALSNKERILNNRTLFRNELGNKTEEIKTEIALIKQKYTLLKLALAKVINKTKVVTKKIGP